MRSSSGGLGEIVDQSLREPVAPVVHPFRDKVKVKVKEYVSGQPEQAVLAAMAAGAVLTGFLRYLIRRKKPRHREGLTR